MEAEVHGSACSSETPQSEEEMDLRRGPWTLEEDLLLVNYIAGHGEGRWNLLARCAGLKRTGKSCRLRWLNYLRPDVRRGNITPEEQLLILELHSLWGNRWSRIAQHLPGRTDNEIKNYWRTRVQKHAKHLQCDVDSKQFKDVMRYLWMPRLIERIRAASRLPPPEIPAAEYGAIAGGDRTFWPDVLALTGRGKAAVPTTDGWSDSRKPSNTRTMSSGGFEVREKRNRGEGVQVTAPPQLGGGKWPGEPSLLNQAYARAGLPELEQYCWGPGAEMNDNLWNMEDSNWFLQ